MQFASHESREAYRQAVRDSLDFLMLDSPAPLVRIVEVWIGDLEAWESGPPPMPLKNWPDGTLLQPIDGKGTGSLPPA